MKRIVRNSMIVVLLATGIAVLGCSRTVIRAGGSKGRTTSTVQTAKKGPPPHAPAHGYRHKHRDGVVLVFEASLGVYVVSGYKNLYYYKDRYYRHHNKKWQSSGHADGPWRKSPYYKVPVGLQKNVASANDGKGKGNGKNK
jgi:hypothetical protein